MDTFSQLNETPVVGRFIKLSEVPQHQKLFIHSISKKYSEKLEKHIVEVEYAQENAIDIKFCVTLPVRYDKFSQETLNILVGRWFTYKGKTNYGVHDLYFE